MPRRWAPRAAGGTCSAADRLTSTSEEGFSWTHFPAVICSAPPARSRPCRSLGPEAWAQAKDRLVIGMSLEPPVLDPTKNAAAAIREVTDAQHLREPGPHRPHRRHQPGPGRELEHLRGRQGVRLQDSPGREVPRRRGARRLGGEVLARPAVRRRIPPIPAKSLYTDIDKVEVVDPVDGQGDAEVAQLLPALQPVAGRCRRSCIPSRRRPTTRTRSAPGRSCSRSARKAIRSRW